jgi:hypothetical protein
VKQYHSPSIAITFASFKNSLTSNKDRLQWFSCHQCRVSGLSANRRMEEMRHHGVLKLSRLWRSENFKHLLSQPSVPPRKSTSQRHYIPVPISKLRKKPLSTFVSMLCRMCKYRESSQGLGCKRQDWDDVDFRNEILRLIGIRVTLSPWKSLVWFCFLLCHCCF